jgi:hypothetical protein
MGRWNDCLHRVARPRLYSLEQWLAATFSAVCLGVDGWVVARTLRVSKSLAGYHTLEDPAFVVSFWILVVLLAAAALSLLVFAFSKPSTGVTSL